MKRKDYFKGILEILIIFPLIGILSLLTMDDVSIPWRVLSSVVLFGTPVGIIIYGLITYKK